MPQVYIDFLRIKNFGPFYGEHEFIFTPLDSRNGVLIGGRNGAGKTHLLRAIYLAVVGESGVLDLKKVESGSEATRFNFDKALNRRAEAENNKGIRLEVQISQRGHDRIGSRSVQFTREISYAGAAPKWKSYAQCSDTNNVISDEQVITKLRDQFLPRHLARFFFFDAERSQSINLGQEDIVEGVTRILGLWTYRELEDDLRQLIQQKIPRKFSASSEADPETKLIDISAEIQRHERHLKNKQDEQSRLQHELIDINDQLKEVEDELETLGAVDPEIIRRTQEKRDELASVKKEMELKLSEAWETALPIALLGKFRKKLSEHLSGEERRREWENAKSAVEPKIPQVLADVFSDVPIEYRLDPNVQSFYSKRLEKALHRLFHPPPEGIPEKIFVADRNDVSAQIRQRLMMGIGPARDLAQLCFDIEQKTIELRELDQKLRQMQQNSSAIEKGRELSEKRGELNAERKDLEKRLSDIESEMVHIKRQLEELKREETKQRQLAEKVNKGKTLSLLAARYREAVAEIRSQAAIQLRNRISEYVSELWLDIVERKHEFIGMEFDKYWQCWLIRTNKEKVRWEDVNTSAGQRQVRMLTFFEALRRLAKLAPPLVVDTPLARLDKEVRANVLDKLYLSGHQAIILATNSEIDPQSELFEKISKRLARLYTLHPHGKPETASYEVKVTNDYFGQKLA